MDDLHISLFSTALAALIALWLGARRIARRYAAKAIHGDGGDSLLARRMRAQANFTEYTPLALLLVLVLDLAGADGSPAGRWAWRGWLSSAAGCCTPSGWTAPS